MSRTFDLLPASGNPDHFTPERAPPRPLRVIFAGECMAELSASPGGGWSLGYAGDALNAAIYAARLLGPRARVSLLTKVGGDPFSARALASWDAEGIGIDLAEVVADRTIGLYAITTDEAGERSFTYWRGESPARDLFRTETPPALRREILAADVLFLTGISLAVLSPDGRDRFLSLAAEAKAAGVMVVFDPNHRHRLWPSREIQHDSTARALASSSMVLTSWEEQMAIFGDTTRSDVVSRLSRAGVREAVIRDGARPITLVSGGTKKKVNFEAIGTPRDTTGAGDSFNAGYLAARLRNTGPVKAAKLAQKLAAAVIMHSGAILPKDEMPEAVVAAVAALAG